MSSGNAASRSFRASCISLASPSKNRPHPDHCHQHKPQSQNTKSLPSLTSDEQSVAGENSLVISVLRKEADAVLSVARRVHTFEGDVTQLEGLTVTRSLGHALAVFAADDIQLGGTEFGKLGRSVSVCKCYVVRVIYQLLVASSMVPMAAWKSVWFVKPG